jgi:hypothetical protein
MHWMSAIAMLVVGDDLLRLEENRVDMMVLSGTTAGIVFLLVGELAPRTRTMLPTSVMPSTSSVPAT